MRILGICLHELNNNAKNIIPHVGAWRSLEARLLWEQEVGGSNPLAPTIKRFVSKALSSKVPFFLTSLYVFL
jgi:hypothetical protein